MAESVDRITVHARFLRAPWGPVTEAWTLECEPGQVEIDTAELDAELSAAFVEHGGANTLTVARTLAHGGWGATGLTVLDFAIGVAENVAADVLLAALVFTLRKFTHQEPVVTKAGGDAPSTPVQATTTTSAPPSQGPRRKAASTKRHKRKPRAKKKNARKS